MKILKKINEKSSARGLSVVIRHADRDKIPADEFGNEVLLNEKGVENALKLGKELQGEKIAKIYTSPILRCVQTASKIEEGYGGDVEIILSRALGDPGLHINDAELAGKAYLEHGFFRLYEMYMNNGVIEGVPSQKQIKDNMQKFLEEKTEEKGVTLFITHDSVIAFFLYAYDQTRFSKANWVDFLDGFCLEQ